jgi:hypothetical protein
MKKNLGLPPPRPPTDSSDDDDGTKASDYEQAGK